MSTSATPVFKVGDRVECVDDVGSGLLRKGYVYVVDGTSYAKSSEVVHLASVSFWWQVRRFRLVADTSASCAAAPRYDVDDAVLADDAARKRVVRGDDWTRGGVAPPREPGYDDPIGDDIAADA